MRTALSPVVDLDQDKTVLGSIRARMDSLSTSDRRVAETILEDPLAVIQMTVAQLADRAGTADSTVVRCTRKLGYQGYQDLKVRLARETAVGVSAASTTLGADAQPHEALRTVIAIHREVLNDITSSITDEEFAAVIAVLGVAEKVVLVGFSSSLTVCKEAEERLYSIGIDATAPASMNMNILACSRLTPKDVLICVSHTGATKETIRYAEIAKERGATVVAITSFGATRLGRTADFTLVAGGREFDLRFGALSGRTAHLAVLDAIYVGLALSRPEEAAAQLSAFDEIEAAWRL